MKTKEKKEFWVVMVLDDKNQPLVVYNTEDEVKENCSDGDIVYQVIAVKKFKVVDESVKLVEQKM